MVDRMTTRCVCVCALKCVTGHTRAPAGGFSETPRKKERKKAGRTEHKIYILPGGARALDLGDLHTGD